METEQQDKSELGYIFNLKKLSEEEYLSGFTFTPIQLASLKQLLLSYMELKINLSYASSDISASIQGEAELTGQIGILKYLLEQHEYNSEEAAANHLPT